MQIKSSRRRMMLKPVVVESESLLVYVMHRILLVISAVMVVATVRMKMAVTKAVAAAIKSKMNVVTKQKVAENIAIWITRIISTQLKTALQCS
jgi:hypothetical protein